MKQVTIIDLDRRAIHLHVPQRLHHQFFPAGFRLRPWRLKDHAFYYITEGRLNIDSDDGAFGVETGDMIFRSPHQRWGWRAETRVAFFHCHFDFEGVEPELVSSSLREWAGVMAQASESAKRNFACLYLPDRIRIRQRDRLSETFAAMVREQNSGDPGRLLAFKGYFLILLRLVSGEVLQALLRRGPAPAPGNPHRHVTRALNVIDSNLARPLSLHDVAENLRLDPAYLSRLFKRYLGESMGAYILRSKLTRAKDMLIASGKSVKEAARAVGFRDALYFSRVFRREEGMSPTEYILAHCDSHLPLKHRAAEAKKKRSRSARPHK